MPILNVTAGSGLLCKSIAIVKRDLLVFIFVHLDHNRQYFVRVIVCGN